MSQRISNLERRAAGRFTLSETLYTSGEDIINVPLRPTEACNIPIMRTLRTVEGQFSNSYITYIFQFDVLVLLLQPQEQKILKCAS
jgi:hypothetical protein